MTPAVDHLAELYTPGRFYLTAAALAPSCGRLPIAGPPGNYLLRTLGPKRPWVALDLTALFDRKPAKRAPCRLGPACRGTCPLCDRILREPFEAEVPYVAGLVWIPKDRYGLPRDWVEQVVNRVGVRWRLRGLPRDYPPRPKMPVLIAHGRGIVRLVGGDGPQQAPIIPAIVYVFRIQAIEYLLTGNRRTDHRRLGQARKLNVTVTSIVTPEQARGIVRLGAPAATTPTEGIRWQ